ncbi:MAG: hypothetical protein ACRDQZ_02045, partial [Mycobacteriales bacterium]
MAHTVRPDRLRAGFVGAIQGKKLDYELLAEVARAVPEIEFCLAGPVATGGGDGVPASMYSIPNVRFLGQLAREEVPALV